MNRTHKSSGLSLASS